jgi:hypothetical protein
LAGDKIEIIKMVGFGGFRSFANPKWIGTILVIFVTINIVFYRYRLDKKLLFLDKATVTDAVSGKGPKSLMFSDALRTAIPNNLTSLNLKANFSSIKTLLKFKGLDRNSYNAGDIPKLLDALKGIQENVEKEDASSTKKLPDCVPKNLGKIFVAMAHGQGRG